MSSRRPFASSSPSSSFSDLYSKKNALTNYQYARSASTAQNNSKNIAFSTCPAFHKSIFWYKSHGTRINLSKISAFLDPNCSDCADVPVNLLNGIQSEVCYNELYEPGCTKLSAEDDRYCGCARCLKIPIINSCAEKTGKMFPYGRFNNSIKNPAIQIQALKNIDIYCQETLECQSYIMCQCSPYNKNCECCKFSTTTPFDANSNIKYVENSDIACGNKLDHHLSHLPKDQLEALQALKDKKLNDDILLSQKAINIFSKFGAPNMNSSIKH